MMKKITLVILTITMFIAFADLSEAYTLSGTIDGGVNLGGITYIYAISLDFANPTFGIGLALLGNGSYSILEVDSGSYIMFAYQDRDYNLMPSVDDYFGYYGETLPEIVDVNGSLNGLDITIAPLPMTTITGSISYAGTQTGLTIMEAATDPDFANVTNYSILFDTTGNGDYYLFVDPGIYYVRAYIDLDLSFTLDEGEANGYYGSPSAVDVTSGSAVNINFALFDNTMPDVTVTLEPIGAPIMIPFWGGDFDYTITLVNNDADSIALNAWIDAVLPDGTVYNVMTRSLNMPGGAQINRTMTQQVPASAPWGEYIYRARMGFYPDIIYSEDSFTFEKGMWDGSENSNPGNTGWDLAVRSENERQIAMVPNTMTMISAYPNPFNPTTEITYSLAADGHISIALFDINGREAEKIFEGFKASGSHSLKFDGSHLSSGVYFLNLTSMGQSSTVKVMLLK